MSPVMLSAVKLLTSWACAITACWDGPLGAVNELDLHHRVNFIWIGLDVQYMKRGLGISTGTYPAFVKHPYNSITM